MNNQLTNIETLKTELKARLQEWDRATAGPWDTLDDTDDFTGLYLESLGHPKRYQIIVAKSCVEDCHQPYIDLGCIAHSRTITPKLIRNVLKEIAFLQGLINFTPHSSECYDRELGYQCAQAHYKLDAKQRLAEIIKDWKGIEG